jgi:hypothetical protein
MSRRWRAPTPSEMPDWQFGIGLSAMGQRRPFVYEALEERVHGNTLPACLLGKPRFDLSRNLDTHGAALFSSVHGGGTASPFASHSGIFSCGTPLPAAISARALAMARCSASWSTISKTLLVSAMEFRAIGLYIITCLACRKANAFAGGRKSIARAQAHGERMPAAPAAAPAPQLRFQIDQPGVIGAAVGQAGLVDHCLMPAARAGGFDQMPNS